MARWGTGAGSPRSALRRLAPASAPKPLQIAVADVPIFLLEVCTTALLLAVATAVGPLLLAGALVVMLMSRRVSERVKGWSCSHCSSSCARLPAPMEDAGACR